MSKRVWGIGTVALLMAGCSGAPSVTPTVAATVRATATLEPSPSAPMATESPSAPTGSYDGIWATEPVTRADMAAALDRAGLDDSVLDEWRDNWVEIDHWMFEFVVGAGEWRQDELADGVRVSGWTGTLTEIDDSTVVIRDEDFGCQVTYEVVRSGEAMTVDLTDSDCTADDIALQTAMVEAAPFKLVEAANWAPSDPTPQATPGAASPAATPDSSSSERQEVRSIGTVDGASLGFLEYLPPTYTEDGAPSPLLVFLHGSGESGDGSEFQLTKLTATAIPQLIQGDRWPDDRPFVVLSPQHEEDPAKNSWCFESSEIDEFLRFAIDEYNVDPQRIYLTGLSCGAIGLWNYLTQQGDELIAAAVPIAGFGLAAFDTLGCDLGTTPIWAFHGGKDDTVPVHGDAFPLTALQECTDPAPVDARLTVYPTAGHDSWTRTYQRSAEDDIYNWMLSHSR